MAVPSFLFFMGKIKQKYYVVWAGVHPGIYHSWAECEGQVKGVAGARYKAFDSLDEARSAFDQPYQPPVSVKPPVATTDVFVDANGMTQVRPGALNPPVLDSLAVDAACSGNPGVMEYQGVYVASRTQVFHFKSPLGTNNIGEFLAIVHGLAYLKKHNLNQIIYSDSVNAISWVRQKQCKSKLPVNAQTHELWDFIHRAEHWLRTNVYSTEIRKWDTDRWGEIPADFNRK